MHVEATANTPSSPEESWGRLLDVIKDQSSLSWVQMCSLSRVDQTTAYISALPGHREVLRFATSSRCEQLAQLLRPILGKPVRVEVTAAGPDTGSELHPQANDTDAAGSSPAPAAGRDLQIGRKEAMALPWVRQVMEVFEATVIDARKDSEK